MYGYNNMANQAITNELMSDLWIQTHVPGGLNSKFIEKKNIYVEFLFSI
jgi:hypothetical protein